MKQFRGKYRRRSYFEGWYLKHQKGEQVLALIPAWHVDRDGNASASLQIVCGEDSWSVPCLAEDFGAGRERFWVRLGGSFFSPKGMTIRVETRNMSISGEIRYVGFHPPESDMMGPFRFLPFLQCNHGLLSYSHRLEGEVLLNGRRLDFTGGTGYIEKDWGSSFPRSYTWIQGGWQEQSPCCVMLSIADIPMGISNFTGCICAVLYSGREYRLATYHGVRILRNTPEEVVLQQGSLRLQALPLDGNAQPLRAPDRGGMTRVIREDPACRVRFRFWEGRRLLFDHVCRNAGYERVEG